MPGIERFQQALISLSQPIIKESIAEHGEELNEAMLNHVLDRGGPIRVEKENYSDKEFFVARLQLGYSDIEETWETIRDTAILIRRFPFSDTRIDRVRYLKLQINTHWGEIYVLRERLVAFAKRLIRTYRGTAHYQRVQTVMGHLPDAIHDGLLPITNRRGRHIHQYRHTDDQLDRLGLLGFFAEHMEDAELWKQYLDNEYREKRAELRREVVENIATLEKALNDYFEVIVSAITKNDEVLLPAKNREAR